MINNKPFKVRYFSAKDKMTITRNALWTDKCKYWTSKANRMLMTYFEEQKEMREELINWIKSCDKFQMLELYSEMRRMKRSWNE